jgi:hypothetical protein
VQYDGRVQRVGCLVLVAVTRIAAANPQADELQARGEALARDGKFGQAIDAFKAADRVELRAERACMIALAYTRLERWAQAEIWLDTCRGRATGGPLPDWVPELETQIHDRLVEAGVAAVAIEVEPHDAHAVLSLSSLPPDETFEARTVHLARGHHVIVVSAPGYARAERAIDITDNTDRHVLIQLSPPKPVIVTPRARNTPVLVGIGLLGGGAIAYGIMGAEWLRLNNQSGFGGTTETIYDATRIGSIALFAAGAACVGYGLLHRDAESPRVSAAPLPGGGFVAIEWQR